VNLITIDISAAFETPETPEWLGQALAAPPRLPPIGGNAQRP
jgi:hypothetical protein